MSRKGNSMDNGMMENFFGLLKTEMFYEQEEKYKTISIQINGYKRLGILQETWHFHKFCRRT